MHNFVETPQWWGWVGGSVLLNNQRLTGGQVMQFRTALLDAFSLQRFDEMLRFQTNRRRENIALGDDFEAIAFRVIDRAEMESWTADLLNGARTSRPENSSLLGFAQQFGLAPRVSLVRGESRTEAPTGVQLQREIRKSIKSVDVAAWREELGRAEGRICRIEVKLDDAIAYGTGFLLGPELLITNFHVLEDVIEGRAKPEAVTFRFDFKMMSDGTTLNRGITHKLVSDDWLVDFSPYSPLDEQVDAKTEPSREELDFVLVRVSDVPGLEPVGGPRPDGTDAPLRGWFELATDAYDFQPDSALYILQHPSGTPLKLALDTQAVIGANASGTRVRYRTNTERGSSGSPCFGANWNLVALHHGGDPDYALLHNPTYNQGIPFSSIVALLGERQKLDLLGSQEP